MERMRDNTDNKKFESFESARRARSYWIENAFDAYNHILLLPHTDKVLNNAVVAAFCANAARSNAIILSRTELRSEICCPVKLVSEEAANDLISLYCMYEFTDKLIIGSFDLPPGRKLRNLLESGAATEDMLINDVILSL